MARSNTFPSTVPLLLLLCAVAQLPGTAGEASSTSGGTVEAGITHWLPGFVRNWFGFAQRNSSKQARPPPVNGMLASSPQFDRGIASAAAPAAAPGSWAQPSIGQASVAPGSGAQPSFGQASAPFQQDLIDATSDKALAAVARDVQGSLAGVQHLEQEVYELLKLLAMEAPEQSSNTFGTYGVGMEEQRFLKKEPQGVRQHDVLGEQESYAAYSPWQSPSSMTDPAASATAAAPPLPKFSAR